jgi:hypothetical protein
LRSWVKDAIREKKIKHQELETREKRLEKGYSYPKAGNKRKIEDSTNIKDGQPSYDIEAYRKYCRESLLGK